MRFPALALILLFLASCSLYADGPLYTDNPHGTEIAPDKALVYVYRVKQYELSGHIATMLDNGEAVGDVNSGGYITYLADPGSHYIRASTGARDEPLTMDFEAGETYYLRLKVVGNTVWSLGFEPFPILPEDALPEIALTRYQGK